MTSPFFKAFLLATGLFLFTVTLFGQVKSGAYRVMLNNLLSHSVPEISVQDALRIKPTSIFLDAREPREFAVSHIEGAIPVGYDHFELTNLPANLSKNQPIVVYCSVGYRSEKVTEKLRNAGFQQVSNLYGGIFEWVNQDLPVKNDSGNTQEVHAYSRSWGVWLKKGKKVYK